MDNNELVQRAITISVNMDRLFAQLKMHTHQFDALWAEFVLAVEAMKQPVVLEKIRMELEDRLNSQLDTLIALAKLKDETEKLRKQIK